MVHLDIGKLLNGYSQKNYNITPKGWDHVDALVSLAAQGLIMSTNDDGDRPLHLRIQYPSHVFKRTASHLLPGIPPVGRNQGESVVYRGGCGSHQFWLTQL